MRSFSGLSTFLLAGIILCSYSSLSQEIPEITAAELAGFTLNRNECFDGESLWGYMNGGADIYLEYGFKTIRVEEFSNENETIKLELYKMEDPVSAFGIYSTKIFRCEQSEVITKTDCLNRFQFQLLYGNYYIQLINESGSEKAKQTMISIAEILLKKIEFRDLILPVRYLTDSLQLPKSGIKMVKGALGVHNKITNLEDCFKGIEDYQVYFAKTVMNGEKVKYYEIVFDKPETKNKFLENNKDNDLQIINETVTIILIQQ